MRVLSLALVGAMLSIGQPSAGTSAAGSDPRSRPRVVVDERGPAPRIAPPRPGLLRMPQLVPIVPGPVPMPHAEPVEPGPVPMPEARLDDPRTVVVLPPE